MILRPSGGPSIKILLAFLTSSNATNKIKELMMLIKSTLLLESSYQKCKFNLTQTVKSQGSSPKIKKIA
jgi:hypothetical protein